MCRIFPNRVRQFHWRVVFCVCATSNERFFEPNAEKHRSCRLHIFVVVVMAITSQRFVGLLWWIPLWQSAASLVWMFGLDVSFGALSLCGLLLASIRVDRSVRSFVFIFDFPLVLCQTCCMHWFVVTRIELIRDMRFPARKMSMRDCVSVLCGCALFPSPLSVQLFNSLGYSGG